MLIKWVSQQDFKGSRLKVEPSLFPKRDGGGPPGGGRGGRRGGGGDRGLLPIGGDR